MKQKTYNTVTCPVCNKEYTVAEDDFIEYSVCPYCEWEFDPVVKTEEDYSSANKCSIVQAKESLNLKEHNTNTNRCVMCGEEIPEGQMVCYLCDKKITAK